VSRLVKRGLTSDRVDDRDENIISARLAEYNKKTAAVADHYKKYDKVKYIKGEGDIDEIFEKLSEEIDRKRKQKV